MYHIIVSGVAGTIIINYKYIYICIYIYLAHAVNVQRIGLKTYVCVSPYKPLNPKH